VADEQPVIKPASLPISPVGPLVSEKFTMLVDLGIVTVPDDYSPFNRLRIFHHQNPKRFHYYNDFLTDKNFSNPSRVLKPGDKLHVCAFQQVAEGTTTSEERLAFLAGQKAVYTGAQGASLVFDQKYDQLPIGKSYVSFDEKEHLWVNARGQRKVPEIGVPAAGKIGLGLGDFEGKWDRDRTILCFTEI
jgi:hypothetical protein